MTANPALIKMRGIDKQSEQEINDLHDKLDELMSRANLTVFNQVAYDEIERIEMALQILWRFGIDKSMHVHKHLYKFRCQWLGRKFQCMDTGVVVEIPEDVRERDLIVVGEGYVDTGRLDGYHRIGGNVKEIL